MEDFEDVMPNSLVSRYNISQKAVHSSFCREEKGNVTLRDFSGSSLKTFPNKLQPLSSTVPLNTHFIQVRQVRILGASLPLPH
jgi:hypothetical protein